MTKIDVVVPCYNYGHYLESCVRSVTDQSITDLRVLIIDDASTDSSLSVAKELAATDPRISVISHAQNWGHISTYNQGIAWASADYFLLLSADDLLAPGALARATGLMDENPDIVLTHGNFIEWHNHLPFPDIDQTQPFAWRRQDLIREMCAFAVNLVCTPSAIVRTSAQKAVGGYRPSLPHSGDMEMWLRLAAHGAVARIDNPVQAIYRRHSANMSIPYFAKKLRDFEERKKVFDSFFEVYENCIFGSRQLRARADHVLAGKVYISGIARLCRGDVSGGFQLLRYAMRLDSKLCYFPPVALALELKAPRLSKLAISLGLWGSEAW